MLSSRERNVRVTQGLHLDDVWRERALVPAAHARRRGVFHPREHAERKGVTGFFNIPYAQIDKITPRKLVFL